MNIRIHELELSGTIDFTRQRDWFDPTSIESKLTVIGVGGIGSLFTVMAGKLGIGEITIFDGDTVEVHNLPNQFFNLRDVGFSKVNSLGSVVDQFSISDVVERDERVEAETKLSGLVVSGLDSMSARKEVAAAVHANRFLIPRYWDARIGGEKIVIYSVNPRDPAEWELFEKTLYADEDAADDPCTRRSVIDVMGHVGSHLLTGVREQLAGETPDGFVYYHVGNRNLYHGTLAEGVMSE